MALVTSHAGPNGIRFGLDLGFGLGLRLWNPNWLIELKFSVNKHCLMNRPH